RFCASGTVSNENAISEGSTQTSDATASPHRPGSSESPLTPGHRREDRDLVSVRHGSVEPVEEADVLTAHIHVDESAQAAVLRDPAAELVVAFVQRVEHLTDGVAVDLGGCLAVGCGPELGRDLDADGHVA